MRIASVRPVTGLFLGVRHFGSSSVLSAKAAPKQKGGKTKAKQGFKTKKDGADSKGKKGGMTHLKFRDAVRALAFEKLAPAVEIESLSADKLSSLESQVVNYGKRTEQKLKALGSFKKYQHHELFASPVSLVSDNLVRLGSTFLHNLDKSSKENRTILTGEHRVGKSVLLSQAKALALSKYNGDVVLLHLDHPEKIIEGSSDYIFNRKMEKYQQPMFTKRWIQKLRTANADVFKKMPLTRDVSFTTKKVEYNLKKDENSLYDYILQNHEFGVVGPTHAFEFLIEEIKHHSKNIPVLVTVDNFNALTTNPLSKYRHPNFEPIHFKDFEVGSFILKLASGELSFDKGGLLLAESSDVGKSKTLSVGLGLEQWDPYFKQDECDATVVEALLSNNGVKVFDIKNLTKQEARNLLDFYQTTGVLQMRQYPTKKEFEENVAPQAVPEPETEIDSNQQFETLLENNYVISSGNPGMFLKNVVLTY